MRNTTQKKYSAKELLGFAKSVKENTRKHANVRDGELVLIQAYCAGEITAKQAEAAMTQAYGIKTYSISSRMSVVLKESVQTGKAEITLN